MNDHGSLAARPVIERLAPGPDPLADLVATPIGV